MWAPHGPRGELFHVGPGWGLTHGVSPGRTGGREAAGVEGSCCGVRIIEQGGRMINVREVGVRRFVHSVYVFILIWGKAE